MNLKKIKIGILLIISSFALSQSLLAADNDQRRWNKPAIPHRGWTHVDVEDLGEPTGICEMCDKTGIRYLHTVSHDNYEDLLVGCVCAEKMSEDYVRPKQREQVAKNEARKIQAAQKKIAEGRLAREHSWLDLGEWLAKDNGNYSKSIGANWVTIFKKDGVWKYVFKGKFSARFATADQAKVSFFNDHRDQIMQGL